MTVEEAIIDKVRVLPPEKQQEVFLNHFFPVG